MFCGCSWSCPFFKTGHCFGDSLSQNVFELFLQGRLEFQLLASLFPRNQLWHFYEVYLCCVSLQFSESVQGVTQPELCLLDFCEHLLGEVMKRRELRSEVSLHLILNLNWNSNLFLFRLMKKSEDPPVLSLESVKVWLSELVVMVLIAWVVTYVHCL